MILKSIIIATTLIASVLSLGCAPPSTRDSDEGSPQPNPAEPGTLQLAVQTKSVSYGGIGSKDSPYDNINIEAKAWSNWWKASPNILTMSTFGNFLSLDFVNLTYISSYSQLPSDVKYTSSINSETRVRWPVEFRENPDPIDFSLCVRNEKDDIGCDGGMAGETPKVLAINQKSVRIESTIDIYGVYFWVLKANGGSSGAEVNTYHFLYMVDDDVWRYQMPYTFSPDVLWGFRYCDGLNTDRDFPAWRNMLLGETKIELPTNYNGKDISLCAKNIQKRVFTGTYYCGIATDANAFPLEGLVDYMTDRFENTLFPGKNYDDYIHVYFTDNFSHIGVSDGETVKAKGGAPADNRNGKNSLVVLHDDEFSLRDYQLLLAHELGHIGGRQHIVSSVCDQSNPITADRFLMCDWSYGSGSKQNVSDCSGISIGTGGYKNLHN